MAHVLAAPYLPDWYRDVENLCKSLGAKVFYYEEDGVATARFSKHLFLRPTPKQLVDLASLSAKHRLTVDMLANRDGGISWNFGRV